MVATSEGLGGAKEKFKRGGRGTSEAETANGKMTLTRQYTDLKTSCINKCLACSLVWWSVFLSQVIYNKIIFWHALST